MTIQFFLYQVASEVNNYVSFLTTNKSKIPFSEEHNHSFKLNVHESKIEINLKKMFALLEVAIESLKKDCFEKGINSSNPSLTPKFDALKEHLDTIHKYLRQLTAIDQSIQENYRKHYDPTFAADWIAKFQGMREELIAMQAGPENFNHLAGDALDGINSEYQQQSVAKPVTVDQIKHGKKFFDGLLQMNFRGWFFGNSNDRGFRPGGHLASSLLTGEDTGKSYS